MRRKIYLSLLMGLLLSFTACGTTEITEMDETTDGQEVVADFTDVGETVTAEESEENSERGENEMSTDLETLFDKMDRASFQKGILDANPIMTQRFGADPYAIVYGDTVYFYMTGDALLIDANGEVQENNYSLVNTISVVSTKDMVNFTDHGEIKVAGPNGAAKWAKNSWAPAVAWKNIDGQDKFFLYFADGGGGIGVLTSDSPVGPFVDPIGKGLIRRDMEMCGNVLWLFDPAVLVDDDGTGYIYFGGGVPEGKASAPGTGRVAKLGDDMISLDGVPVAIDVPYLFEDSGIHKYNNKYYYTYCSNFSVDKEGTEKYGFKNGEICVLVSDNPMGPFTYQERILKNPGDIFGLSGNNHHCVFSFKNQWYITYHTRVLEEKLGCIHSYRCTFISPFEMGTDGTIGLIEQSLGGREQILKVNPYETVNATTCALMAGTLTASAGNASDLGEWCLSGIETGAFTKVQGVDFGATAPTKVSVTVRKAAGSEYGNATILPLVDKKDSVDPAAVQLRVDTLRGTVLATIDLSEAAGSDSFVTVTADLTGSVTDVHDLYLLMSGSGYEILDWSFVK